MSARVEFCGVPASGKSTLCAGALRLLRDRGHAVLGREEMVDAGLRGRDFGLLGNFLGAVVPGWRREFLGLPHGLNDWHRFVVDHPEFAARIHEWLAERGTDEQWRSCIFYSLLTTAFEYQLSQTAMRPILLDEGFAQRLFTLRGYRGIGQAGDAVCYARAMPLPSGLVWVSTPPEVCAERLKQRAELPVLLQGESDSMLVLRLTEGQTLLADLAATMEEHGVAVLRIDGSGSLEAEASQIEAFAEGIFGI